MNSIINLSEATMLALHSISAIAKSRDKRLTTKDIALILNASENHLAKINQRLTKMRLIESVRGPSGGFILKESPDKISLLDIIENFEGKFDYKECLMNLNNCPFKDCLYSNINKKLFNDFITYFKEKKLSDVI